MKYFHQLQKSFRLHLLLQLGLCMLIFVLATRYISLAFIKDYTRENLKIELATQLSEGTNGLSTSAQRAPSLNNFSQHFNLQTLTHCWDKWQQIELICQMQKTSSPNWELLEVDAIPHWNQKFEFTSLRSPTDEWLVVRQTNLSNGDIQSLALDTQEIEGITNFIWHVRNRTVYVVLPIMALILALIGLYIVHFTLKSIRNVETYVTQTDASNLDSPLPISPPYREFQSFIDVFAKLKNRLKESFDLTQSFTSNVAHELKTPLAILRAQASQGLQDAPLNSKSQTQFTLISEQIERVISITDKLFLLAQIDSERLILNRTKLNLSQMIVDIFKDAEHLREDVSFHMDIQPQVIWSCDVALIQVLIHNLFTNAIKYTNSSGRIECQLHCNAQSLCLKVINTCPSSSESWTPRAFERFYRHHHEHMTSTEGLGLGLSICQQIAKIHQGNIWIESPSPNEVCVVFKAVFLRT